MSAQALPDARTCAVHYDHRLARDAVKIQPGEYHVSADDVVLVTVLGSCVSACIADTALGIGGMNHFMLPGNTRETAGPDSASARYGVYAMELLINRLLKLGASRARLEAKVFGGGNVVAGMTHANIGERNAAFVLEFLEAERIRLAARDLLDVYPRKVCYFARSGRALVKKLRMAPAAAIIRDENDYRQRLNTRKLGGDVELFD
ncbi:MAG TPA: chemoreceptor glutamine deamidase CheD [Burkholderiales bacterium]|nr:chemoreceptor glutamine deamidase CheD [Burkholderiales bacterium]